MCRLFVRSFYPAHLNHRFIWMHTRTLIEKYTRGVSAVESILTLDRLRQSVAIKELEQSHGQSLSMRKTVSVPNFSQVRFNCLRVQICAPPLRPNCIAFLVLFFLIFIHHVGCFLRFFIFFFSFFRSFDFQCNKNNGL